MGRKQSVGWIGLGKMGNPMSRNLLKAGYPLTVYDIVPENCGKLVEQGAKAENSPKAVAAGVDVLISMIPDDPALEAVSIGPTGLFRMQSQARSSLT